MESVQKSADYSRERAHVHKQPALLRPFQAALTTAASICSSAQVLKRTCQIPGGVHVLLASLQPRRLCGSTSLSPASSTAQNILSSRSTSSLGVRDGAVCERRVRRDRLGLTACFIRRVCVAAATRGKRAAAPLQLLNADNIAGKQIWQREKTAEFCLRILSRSCFCSANKIWRSCSARRCFIRPNLAFISSL